MKLVLKITGSVILYIILILVIWQPVLPSKYLIMGMARGVEKNKSSLEKSITVRFNLRGRGGGIYNLVADKNQVTVMEGETERVDLIIFMKATDFNSMAIKLATGKADEYTIQSLMISNFLDMAGDFMVLGKLMGE